jgi:MFS family permease
VEIRSLRDLSPQQLKSGVAAWLGWMFDGLDMHLYTLVAAPFVMQLIHAESTTNPAVGHYSSIIQAAFLIGWAFGGGFFGWIGDRLGRSRTLTLTILTYSVFTGLSFFATTWWQLMIFRFLAALGIGGEWAVGASLLSETWPKRWRAWIAAVLQSGVNVGILLAAGVVAANAMVSAQLGVTQTERFVFLAGILPALLTLWIRRNVPEPEEWHAVKSQSTDRQPGLLDLFRGEVRRTTVPVLITCAVSLTAHWALMFWYGFHLRNHSEIVQMSGEDKTTLASTAMFILMAGSIAGNFVAAWLARRFGYPKAIAMLCLAYAAAVAFTYGTPRPVSEILWLLAAIGICQGVFALFTMYLPPLFPTLLRTTGAGFCYNIGRVVAAGGVVFFGLFSEVGDSRMAIFYAGLLFIPASVIAFRLPKLRDDDL